MFRFFRNKAFLLHQVEGFFPYATANAYNKEELNLKLSVRIVSISYILQNGNVISSHVIYKVKVEDEHYLPLRARIFPHYNEDSPKYSFQSDCSMFSPVEMRINLSVASFQKFRLSNNDVNTTFLLTCEAQRNVYVVQL